MKSRKHVQALSTIDSAATLYLELKQRATAIEKEQHELAAQIKTYLMEATPTKAAMLAGREFFLCEQVREVFDLKRARLVLKDDQLKPFVKLAVSHSLRTR